MATAPAPNTNETGLATSKSQKTVSYGSYIETQLGRTRSQVKWVEIFCHLLILVVGVVAALLTMVVIDHWIAPLNTFGRWLCLLGLLLGAGYYIVRSIVPLFLRRVNAVYAALAIEQNLPSLKNSLVNLLMLRSAGGAAPVAVIEAMEAQAATRLSYVDTEVHVDRSRLIRLGYVLLGVMVVAALYGFISPKDPLQTFRRVFTPWSSVAAPTRVQITRVTPGSTTIFRDGQVTVQAVVQNLGDQPVELFYSSLDEQRRIDHRRIPLVQKSPGHFEADLPGGVTGLQESVEYFVRAGDAQSPVYQVAVQTPPAISVKQVLYKYPEYTGRDRPPSSGGDIQALEGAVVTLQAEANQDIREAWLDLNCDGRNDLRMKHDGRTASVSFVLRMSNQPGEGRRGEHDSYQIRYVNTDQHENPRPIRYKISTIADDPPQVVILDPKQPVVEVPVNGSLPIHLRAEDPDFALSRVTLVAERESASGRLIVDRALLEKLHPGEFKAQYTFVPGEHQLQAGETVLVRGIAFDNKHPEPNIAKSENLRIKIVAPREGDPQQPPMDQNQQKKPDQQQPDPKQKPGGDPQNQKPQDGDNEKPEQGKPENGDPNKGDPDKAEQGKPEQGKPEQGKPEQGKQGEQQPGAEGEQGKEPMQGENPMPGENPMQGENPMPGDQGNQPNQDPKQGEQGQEPKQGQEPNDQQGNQPQDGKQPGSQPKEDFDPKQDPGKVIEQLLKDQQQKDQEQKEKEQGKQDQPQQNQPQNQPQSPMDQNQPGGAGEQNNNNQQQQQQNSGGQGNQQSSSGQQNPGQQNNSGGNNQPSPQNGKQPSQNNSGQGQNNSHPDGQQPPAGQQPGAGEKPMDPRGSSTQKGEGDNNQQGGTQQQRPDPKTSSGANSGQQKPENAQPGQGEKPPGAQSQESKGTPDGAPKPSQSAEGKGGQTKPNTEENMNEPSQGKEKPEHEGGDDSREKGAGGAGSSNDSTQGSPMAQEKAQAKDGKEASPGETESPKEPNAAQSPSNSEKESDSQGESDGDRSGGGKEGGGQSSNQKGTGGAGQNTAADEGASKAPGSGKGEDSSEAGNKKEADGKTGAAGEQAGEGSQSREGGSATGNGKGKPQGGNQPKPPGDPMSNGSTDERNQSPPGGEQATPDRTGGGQPGQNNSGAPDANSQGTGGRDNSAKPTPKSSPDFRGEDPNLEYANKATDLALKHLREELAKETPDPALLNKIRMNKDEARDFLDRMEQTLDQSRQAGEAGEVARNRLRNLGVRPSSDGKHNDTERGLIESTITKPPAEYREEFRSYNERGTRPSRGR